MLLSAALILYLWLDMEKFVLYKYSVSRSMVEGREHTLKLQPDQLKKTFSIFRVQKKKIPSNIMYY